MPQMPADLALNNLPVVRDGGFEIQMEVRDLSDAPLFRILDPATGEDHYLSLEAVEKIRVLAPSGQRSISLVHEARFLENHPARTPELAGLIRQGAYNEYRFADGTSAQLGAIVMSSNETAPEWLTMPREGEPKLAWRQGEPDGTNCGWSLSLHDGGAANLGTALGFAAWNDPEGIKRLVHMLQDRQSVYVMSGVMDSTSTARLSSRLTALTMRRGRKLPAIKLKVIRDLLVSSNLTDGVSHNLAYRARGRVLSVEVDGATVPVAVAIIAPQRPNTCEAFPDGLDQLSWNDRQTIIRGIEQAGRDEWTARAKAAIEAAGWRIVDLPRPEHSYNSWRVRYSNSSNGPEMFYATRIKDDVWSEVYPAAASAAEAINLNRTSII